MNVESREHYVANVIFGAIAGIGKWLLDYVHVKEALSRITEAGVTAIVATILSLAVKEVWVLIKRNWRSRNKS